MPNLRAICGDFAISRFGPADDTRRSYRLTYQMESGSTLQAAQGFSAPRRRYSRTSIDVLLLQG